MKSTLTRMLCVCLSFLCFLSLAACTAPREENPVPPPFPHDSEDKPAAIIDFVQKNQVALDEVVAYVTASEGVSYYYFVSDDLGYVHAEQLLIGNGSSQRQKVRVPALDDLADTRFTGEVIYNSAGNFGVVSFYTYMSDSEHTYMFVWCPTDEAVDYIRDGFFQTATKVITTLIVDRWYCVVTG